MVQYEVVGFRKYEGNFEGKAYSGYYVHCIYHANKEGFEGKACKELKVKSRVNYVPRVGDIIWVLYDEYGISEIKVVS